MAQPGRDKPSLEGARARTARASEHIVQLEREIDAALATQPSLTMISVPPFSTGRFEDVSHIGTPVAAPLRVSVLIGEVAYNLKAALDYLVHELVWLDSGKPRYGTKFVIATSPKQWARQFPQAGMEAKTIKELWMIDLLWRHQAALTRLQPFDGAPQWLRTLQDLTNIDKHRFLHRARARFTGADIDANPSRTPFTIPSGTALPAGVDARMIGEVTLEDGTQIVDTLHMLHREVEAVIAAFAVDFP